MKTFVTVALATLFSTGSLLATVLDQPVSQQKMSNRSVSDSTKPKKKKAESKVQYTCSMHPDILSAKPGKCPKCGMKLDKVEAETT